MGPLSDQPCWGPWQCSASYKWPSGNAACRWRRHNIIEQISAMNLSPNETPPLLCGTVHPRMAAACLLPAQQLQRLLVRAGISRRQHLAAAGRRVPLHSHPAGGGVGGQASKHTQCFQSGVLYSSTASAAPSLKSPALTHPYPALHPLPAPQPHPQHPPRCPPPSAAAGPASR